MNANKTGKFIKELRTENNLTQDDLADQLFVSRQAISKWEKGKSSPTTELLTKLSEIFNITINELLTGEKNEELESDNNQIDILKDVEKPKRKFFGLTIVLIIILVLSCLFLSYYFIISYNKIKVYKVSAVSDKVTITNGILVKTNEKIYFILGEIDSRIDINQLKLSYIDEDNQYYLIYSCENCSSLYISLMDYKGYNNYFEFDNLTYMIDNMYLRINEQTDNINLKLNIEQDFSNNKFFYRETLPISSDNMINIEVRNDYERLIKEMTKKYRPNDDGYIYTTKNKQEEIEITYLDNNIILELKNKNKTESWILNTLGNSIEYNNSDNLHFIYDKRNDICLDGDCKTKQEKLDLFFKIIENSLDK